MLEARVRQMLGLDGQHSLLGESRSGRDPVSNQTRWSTPKQQHLELNSGLNTHTCPTYTNTCIHTSKRRTSLLCLDYNSLLPPFPEIPIILNFIVLLPMVLAFATFACLSNVRGLFWCKWAYTACIMALPLFNNTFANCLH